MLFNFLFRRRVFDQQTGGEIELTDEQIQRLNNMATNRYSDPTYNPYEPFYDIFSHKKEIHPISNRPEDKRSFIPSADERKLVGRLLHAMKMGWLKPREPKKPEEVIFSTFQLYFQNF
jgi:ribosome biogenesis protein ERB1